MRLWTLHPRYLDPQGLVALWRETLLARAVLRGLTKGYRHHPQLERFQVHATPRSAINGYLAAVYKEAISRDYAFDGSKLGPVRNYVRITVTTGQLEYEWQHLLRKLRRRSPTHYRRWRDITTLEAHPSFRIIKGPIAAWERPT
ncbi:MAG: pyrimidine dimer DNA glycosylase/endonuclease V [Gammaproteobacteria bacterium]